MNKFWCGAICSFIGILFITFSFTLTLDFWDVNKPKESYSKTYVYQLENGETTYLGEAKSMFETKYREVKVVCLSNLGDPNPQCVLIDKSRGTFLSEFPPDKFTSRLREK